MKQRIITGAVGVAVLVIVLLLRNTLFFPILVGLLSLIAVNEVMNVIGIKSKFVLCLSLLYAAVIPYVGSVGNGSNFKLLTIAYACILMIALVVDTNRVTFKDIASSFVATLFVSYAFSSLVFLRDIYKEAPEAYNEHYGFFFILLVLVAAWGSDTGAYFTGVFFGKHKLCPNISPKKTVEGLLGGLAMCAILTTVMIAIFNACVDDLHIDYLTYITVSLMLSIFGVFGDLCASVIKRNHNVKDFGHILPGHGSIMDRFDSVAMIAPVMYEMALLMAKLSV